MAGLCVLHNDPIGARRAFQAFDARETEPLDLGVSRRAKLWELSPNLHCSIVGTCLTAPELRQVFVRVGDADARTASDHTLHGRGVRAASRREDGGKQLGKALDKRHEGAIRRFGKVDSTARLRALWRESLDHGDIAGPYWALLTHSAADSELFQDVFGDVHMLSHQVGAAARLDIARLRRLEAELSERDEKIARQQARLAEAAAERAETQETIARLESRLAAREATAAAGDTEAPGIEPARRALAAEAARAAALAGRLAASEELRARAEALASEARAEAALSRRELAALETAMTVSETSGEIERTLRGARLLYVGGRPRMVDQLRAFVAARGGALLAHDGGVEDNLALLPGLVSQADAVYFPVDCVSHSAAEKVKTVCGRLGKTWAPLRSASVASFVSGIAKSESRMPDTAG
jgi:hypothetical protein